MLTNKHEIEYYKLSVDECIKNLHSNAEWLDSTEVESRLKYYGKNVLQELHREPLIFKFIKQFKDALIILLIISCGISLYLEDYRWAIILWVIVLINAVIGYVQEAKAEKIMQSLKNMLHPTVKVKRNWKIVEELSENLVPWDIVYIEEWDSVVADMRIIEKMNLQTNDFSLTGESNPVSKFTHPIWGFAEIGERHNLLFMWTTVATGHWFGLVIGTWMSTELGRIATLSHEAWDNEQTPIQKELTNIAKKLTIWTIILCSLLVLVTIFLDFTLTEAFIFAIWISAAMVPQWLPAQVSIALSLASWRLAKNNALVKQLSSVETLGCVNIICTDKTWTITKNEMTVKNIYVWNTFYDIKWTWYEPVWYISTSPGVCEIIPTKDGNEESCWEKELVDKEFLEDWKHFFYCCFLNSNAHVNPPDEDHKLWYCIWDPTEAALIVLAQKAWFDIEKLRKDFENIHEYGFDSVRKIMSTIRKIDWKDFLYVKWSPQEIIARSTMLFDGKIVKPFEDADKKRILAEVDIMAGRAMRNIAIAYKEIDWDNLTANKYPKMEEVESDLIFLWFTSIIDPPRDEVKYAISSAHAAKIKVVMITGDSEITAKAIWEKVWLIRPGKTLAVLTWSEIKQKNDIQILKIFDNDAVIFCRTSPEDKLRIVSILKKNKNIVAVTWDGINDAPALRMANVWVAMWKIWTDVAKEASEIVLLDDSFHTLVYSIREGRIIFQNLKKTVISCITSNGWELFIILSSLVARAVWNIPMAINPVQILAVDLIWEMWPLSALTFDPAQKKVMTEKPRNIGDHILNRYIIIDLIRSWALMWFIWFAWYLLYFVFHWLPLLWIQTWTLQYAIWNSVAYTTIMLCQFANIISRRAWWTESAFSSYLWSNKKLLFAFAISIICIMLLVYNPLVSYYFQFGTMNLFDWALPLSGWLLYFAIRELYKLYRRKTM